MANADGARSAALGASGVLLRVLADVAAQRGVSPARLFGADAERFVWGEPLQLRVSLTTLGGLVARAIELTGDPALGLRCGLSASDPAFDLLAPLVSHLPSLRDAIHEAGRFAALVLDGASMQLGEGGGVAWLEWHLPSTDPRTDRFLAELAAAGVVRMLRSFGAAHGDVRKVCFPYKPPSQLRAYADAFHGTERFGSPCSRVELAAHLLDRPHLHCNPSLQRIVHAQAEERLAQLGAPPSVASRLRLLLLGRHSARVPTMSAAARMLGMSVRSLRRHLSEEQVSFRALTQELQRERACALLRNRDLTLQAVADALGFADVIAFHRAFKRWTQMTPCAYRARAA